jgi:putative ABC transport system ATP-binding protein
MSDSNTIITARGVKRRYMMGDEEVWALAGIDLDIYRGEYISIMGPSGSGKSTFFNMIGGLDRPTEGSILLDGSDMRKMDTRQIAYLRCHKVGFIFQTFNLVQVMTAEQNVMLPMTFAGVPDDQAMKRSRELLDMVGLGSRYDHRPEQLSGGQQQRVAIARAMANDPDIILADEPTGNLDQATADKVAALLFEMHREEHVTLLAVTHSEILAGRFARRFELSEGNLIQR